MLDGVDVVRYRYAPRSLETLVSNGGIAANLKSQSWKWLLLPTFLLSQFAFAVYLVFRLRVSLIHAHWLIPQGLIALMLGRIPKASPYIVTSHGGDMYSFKGAVFLWVKRLVARNSSAMTVVSHALLDEAARLALRPPVISVQAMGVDLQARFTPDPSVQRSTDEILFVGRFVEKKGAAQLIEALPEVLRHYPSASLTMAGFGPLESALRAQMDALGLGGKITFLGPVPQDRLPQIYRRAALLVAPFLQAEAGDQDGLGLVLLEAIGCGCPVVVGDIPAVHELFDPRSAHVVNPRDRHQLASAIIEVLENPLESRSASARMREAFAASFDWDRVAEGYAELYRGVLGIAAPVSQ